MDGLGMVVDLGTQKSALPFPEMGIEEEDVLRVEDVRISILKFVLNPWKLRSATVGTVDFIT